ncbi:hypothetical protein CWI39_0277p0020 [Hamiltosporidium magnivora]|uniref:Calponin-homology (CH) domain-containing protein n=1 Tax=Hamiltosporidium magnivora TaxID=148818 RepID=A0A4Q9LK93_9MICR|nr:hypothetical protein CWI39_0277p0020 [Hamiltosporidium magnivora]
MTTIEEEIDRRSIDNGLKRGTRCKADNEKFEEFLDNEGKAYSEHLKSILPDGINIDNEYSVYENLRDGIILAYALDEIKPGCINFNKLTIPVNFEDKNGIFEATGNIARVLMTAKKIGIITVNIGAEDILNMHKGLVLGLLWQIVRMSLTKTANISKRPELVKLLEQNESLKDIASQQPEDLLIRWVNYHLEKSKNADIIKNLNLYTFNEGKNENKSIQNLAQVFNTCFTGRKIDLQSNNLYISKNLQENYFKCKNFSTDIKDSKIYLILMKQIAPDLVSDEDFMCAWSESDDLKRAEKALIIAEKLECRKFVSARDIIAGDSRLNFLFVATLFNKHIGISNTVENKKDDLSEEIERYKSEMNKLHSKINELATNNDTTEIELKYKEMEENYKNELENRKVQYNKSIEDLLSSLKEFTNQVNNHVKSSVGISYDKDEEDSKKKLWEIINDLLNEILKLKNEKETLNNSLDSKKAVDKLIDKKILEYLEIQKKMQKNEIKKKKKLMCSIFPC